MRALLLLGAALLASLAAPAAARADSLEDLEKALNDVVDRLVKLKDLAGRDWREARVDAYAKYTSEDFKAPKREVRAEDLVDYITDPEVPPSVRIRAKDVLVVASVKFDDPDLSRSKRSGGTSNLAKLSQKLAKVLKEKEERPDGSDAYRLCRAMADEILRKWWGAQTTEIDVTNYDPDKERTWKPAERAWQRLLAKK
jgi:hypothetical protein